MSSLKDNSYLRKLDLRYNDLGDIGQEILQHERLSLRYWSLFLLLFVYEKQINTSIASCETSSEDFDSSQIHQ